MSEQSIEAVMAQAMAAENRRRELASQAPGLGALLPMEQPPNGPGVGKYGLPGMDIAGEGYATMAPDDAQQLKAYGMVRPHYADPVVAGLDYRPAADIPLRRSIIDPGYGRLLTEGRGAPAADPVVVSPPAARPGLLARLISRVRGRR
jgi:hypothetical protein